MTIYSGIIYQDHLNSVALGALRKTRDLTGQTCIQEAEKRINITQIKGLTIS